MLFTDLGMTKHEGLGPGRSGVRSSGLDLFKLMRCPGSRKVRALARDWSWIREPEPC